MQPGWVLTGLPRLNNDERAAVDGDRKAVERFLERLETIPERIRLLKKPRAPRFGRRGALAGAVRCAVE